MGRTALIRYCCIFTYYMEVIAHPIGRVCKSGGHHLEGW
ncbi:hypothetical protein ID866_6013 [Astraeus odoratus]|nr:hypothetical protein ID866_6013 [Astraeus odoratus]